MNLSRTLLIVLLVGVGVLVGACGLLVPPPAPIPSGGKIAFASGRNFNNDIYRMNPDGTVQERLTQHAGDDSYPVWSPDRTRIAFISNRAGSNDIWVMQADGSKQTNVTQSLSEDIYPAWSPDGNWIVFVSDRSGNPDLYVIQADGDLVFPLIEHPANDTAPTWSPDGTQIAFISDREGLPALYTVRVVLDALAVQGEDAAAPVRVLGGDDFSLAAPAWSPDGTEFALTIEQHGMRDLAIVQADGSGLQRISDGTAAVFEPAWSPDGQQLVFYSQREPDRSTKIYRINRDGSALTRLTDLSNPAGDFTPHWAW